MESLLDNSLEWEKRRKKHSDSDEDDDAKGSVNAEANVEDITRKVHLVCERSTCQASELDDFDNSLSERLNQDLYRELKRKRHDDSPWDVEFFHSNNTKVDDEIDQKMFIICRPVDFVDHFSEDEARAVNSGKVAVVTKRVGDIKTLPSTVPLPSVSRRRPFQGLANVGKSCWMNCILQVWVLCGGNFAITECTDICCGQQVFSLLQVSTDEINTSEAADRRCLIEILKSLRTDSQVYRPLLVKLRDVMMVGTNRREQQDFNYHYQRFLRLTVADSALLKEHLEVSVMFQLSPCFTVSEIVCRTRDTLVALSQDLMGRLSPYFLRTCFYKYCEKCGTLEGIIDAVDAVRVQADSNNFDRSLEELVMKASECTSLEMSLKTKCQKGHDAMGVTRYIMLPEVVMIQCLRGDRLSDPLRRTGAIILPLDKEVDLERWMGVRMSEPDSKTSRYRVVAVVHFDGADNAGHYYVTCRKDNAWVTFNDEKCYIAPVDVVSYCSRNAYAVFFRKK